MTKDEVSAVRVQWEQREIPLHCDHITVEMELNDLGNTTGNYVCILCGESVAHRLVDHAESVMAKPEGGALLPEQVEAPICPHYKLGLGHTDDDRLTSTYHCRECGEPYITKL